MEWADALAWRSVLALPEAQSDNRLRDCLYHTHLVQWAYLQIWRGETIDLRDASSFEDLRDIREWSRAYHSQLHDYLNEFDAEVLEREVRFPWADQMVEQYGEAQAASVAETILQIAAHTTYHRGQINMRLRDLGAEPPLTDFIAWIWMGRPAAEW
jgi:uncharacterized damage-inducible protein DinB